MTGAIFAFLEPFDFSWSADMSRTVHQFFSLLRDDEENDVISDAWEQLSIHERLEAIEVADDFELELLEGPENGNVYQDSEMQLTVA